jgi:glucose-6-phosphate isomerase
MGEIDREGMLEATYRLVNVFANPSRFRQRLVSNGSWKDLVFVGMGGSASAGDVLLDWLSERITVPSHMVRDFPDSSLPRAW